MYSSRTPTDRSFGCWADCKLGWPIHHVVYFDVERRIRKRVYSSADLARDPALSYELHLACPAIHDEINTHRIACPCTTTSQIPGNPAHRQSALYLALDPLAKRATR